MKYLTWISFVFLLLGCSSTGVWSLTKETPPAEAVEMAFLYLDLDQKIRRIYAALPAEYYAHDYRVVNAKQIDLDNRNFEPGTLEQWCLAVEYEYQWSEDGPAYTTMDTFILGRFPEYWDVWRAEPVSFGEIRLVLQSDLWRYYCPDRANPTLED